MIKKAELERVIIFPSHFCIRYFYHLYAALKFAINFLILSCSNDYVWISDFKLETVIEIALMLFSL
jgi:hypothetical protein